MKRIWTLQKQAIFVIYPQYPFPDTEICQDLTFLKQPMIHTKKKIFIQNIFQKYIYK